MPRGFGQGAQKNHLIHYTLNTGDTFDCSAKKFHKDVLSLLKPMANRALIEGQSSSVLPNPLAGFNVKTAALEGCALFDVYAEDVILTTNAVAWRIEEGARCWEEFE